MDAFESIIASLLWDQGYWTTVGYKVNLPKEKKAELGKPSMPRPELDVLAYRTSDNSLLWIECKSYLDSRGVIFEALINPDEITAQRYKVFTWSKFREVVTNQLVKQLIEEKRILPEPSVKYGLATGKIATDNDRTKLHQHFEDNGWILYDEYWVKQQLEQLSKKGYENDLAVIVAKLFTRISSG